jgi:hypothetical protein
MKIKSIFNDNGKTLQEIIEEFLIDYCLGIN